MDECYTCTLTKQREAGLSPLWDDIYRGQHWNVVHSYNTALPGWLVLVARRHIAAIHEMTEAEAIELGSLQRRVSLALQAVTGCTKTYVAQFAEAPGHHHVHFHVAPRMADQPDEYRGPQIFKYLGVPEAARVSDARMNEIGEGIRRSLIASE